MSTKTKYITAKRPVEKNSIVFRENVQVTQRELVLKTSNRAETCTGGSIIGSAVRFTGTNAGHSIVVLVLVPDGEGRNTISVGSGGTIYKPEKNILWSKVFVGNNVANGEYVYSFTDKIKTQRKLQEGDSLWLLFAGEQNDTFKVSGVANLFYKQ